MQLQVCEELNNTKLGNFYSAFYPQAQGEILFFVWGILPPVPHAARLALLGGSLLIPFTIA